MAWRWTRFATKVAGKIGAEGTGRHGRASRMMLNGVSVGGPTREAAGADDLAQFRFAGLGAELT